MTFAIICENLRQAVCTRLIVRGASFLSHITTAKPCVTTPVALDNNGPSPLNRVAKAETFPLID